MQLADSAPSARSHNGGARSGPDMFGLLRRMAAGLGRGGAMVTLAVVLFAGALLIALIGAVVLMVASIAGLAGRMAHPARGRARSGYEGEEASDEILEARPTARGWMVDPRRS